MRVVDSDVDFETFSEYHLNLLTFLNQTKGLVITIPELFLDPGANPFSS